ncbi:MAG: metallophosphoesterase [Anaerolineae bacterium]
MLGGLFLLLTLLQDTPELERVTVGDPGGPSDRPITLVQMSDLHMSGWRDVVRLRIALALVVHAEPDLIVLTGDYVREDARTIDLAAPLLKELAAPLGVYAVLGNHDLWTDRQVVTAGLTAAGITVLDNQGLALTSGNTSFYLAGLDDAWSGTPDLAVALADNSDGRAVVLLVHEPDLGHELVSEKPVWLLLAGHSHGGQVRLPRRGALILPEHAHRFEHGLYAEGSGYIYVNRGMGTTTIPIRLGCRPEVTVMTLYPPPPAVQAAP